MTLIITLPLLLQVMGYVLEPLRGQLERLVYGAFADEQPSETTQPAKASQPGGPAPEGTAKGFLTLIILFV